MADTPFAAEPKQWLKPLLILIEYNQTDNSKVSFIKIDNKLDADHILPKAWNSVEEWKILWPDEEKAKKCLDKMGNLTLLSYKKNRAQKNVPPLKKKEMYEKGHGGMTAFEISKNIIKVFETSGWTYEDGEKRQLWLIAQLELIIQLQQNREP